MGRRAALLTTLITGASVASKADVSFIAYWCPSMPRRSELPRHDST